MGNSPSLSGFSGPKAVSSNRLVCIAAAIEFLGSNRTKDGSLFAGWEPDDDRCSLCRSGKPTLNDETKAIPTILPRRRNIPKPITKLMAPLFTVVTASSPPYVSPTPSLGYEPKLHALWGTTLVGATNEMSNDSSFQAPLQRKLCQGKVCLGLQLVVRSL